MLVDAHQHIWTEPLVDALAAREAPPLVRRERGQTVLYAAGEQPYVVNPRATERDRRFQANGGRLLSRLSGTRLRASAAGGPSRSLRGRGGP